MTHTDPHAAKKKSNRFETAVLIQQGACNPSGIVRALMEAIDDTNTGGTDSVCKDPAVRLIAHQLAFLLNVSALDNELDAFGKAMQACEDRRTFIFRGGQSIDDIRRRNADAVFENFDFNKRVVESNGWEYIANGSGPEGHIWSRTVFLETGPDTDSEKLVFQVKFKPEMAEVDNAEMVTPETVTSPRPRM